MRRVALLLLAGAALGDAQVVQVGGSYKLRVRWSKGQVLAYDLTGGGLGQANSISMKGSMKMIVEQVRGGVADIRIEQGEVKLNGKPMDAARTLNGSLDSRMRPAGPDSVGSFEGLYPEKPVKIGQSWKAPLKLAMAGGGVRGITATYTLRRIATVDGVRVAVLETKLGGAFEGTGVTTIRVSDGTPQKVVLDIGGVMATTSDPKQVKFRFGVYRR